jgi:nucleotide-binding universal stress UspA family protein
MGVNRTGVDQFQLRLPAGLRDRIKERAEANGRSANAEIVAAIEAALDQPDLGVNELREMLDEERTSYSRLETLYENAFELVMNYKDFLRSTKGRMLHFVSTLNSLASVIRAGEAPSEELVEVAGRIAAATRQEKALLEVELELVESRPQPEEIRDLMEKAKSLLEKPEQ